MQEVGRVVEDHGYFTRTTVYYRGHIPIPGANAKFIISDITQQPETVVITDTNKHDGLIMGMPPELYGYFHNRAAHTATPRHR